MKRTIGVLLAATLSVSIVPAAAESPEASAPTPPAQLWTERTNIAPLEPDAPVSIGTFSKLAAELSPTVVNITTKRASHGGPHPLFHLFGGRGGPGGERFGVGLGTGFVIHASGYVLTNHHVIHDADTIEVTLHNGNSYEARVVGSWQPLDVALLQFKPDEDLEVAALGDSSKVAIGEWVMAIGNAMGLNHTVTAGIVSAKGRRNVQPGREPMMANFIQTDASINPGNSGGPLISTRGEVIGINTAINAAGQGIGFAVPINMVKVVIPQLVTGEVKRSYLGVRVGPVDRALAKKLGLAPKSGTLIREVLPALPAARAGLKAGDIVTTFDGHAISHWEELPWYASTASTRHKVKLDFLRRGKKRSVAVKLTHFPENQPASAMGTRGGAPPSGAAVKSMGLRLGPLTKPLQQRLRMSPRAGVTVLEVEGRSAAYLAGLRAGDVIRQLNYEDVGGSPTRLKDKLERIRAGDIVSLLIQRDRRQIFMAFPR
jgi:serine protease Do